MITNYTELQTEVMNFLVRPDLVSDVPTFISLCEARVRRNIRSKNTDIYPLTVAQGDGTVDLPSGLVEVISVSRSTADREGNLDSVSYSELLEHRRSHPVAGTPSVYAVVGTTIYFSPVADVAQAFDVEAEGFTNLAASVSGTNWLLDNHPDIYLYGALAETAPFLKEDERLAVWTSRYDQAMAELEVSRDRSQFPSTPIRPVPVVFE